MPDQRRYATLLADSEVRRLNPEVLLATRVLRRHQAEIGIVAEGIRRGQHAGRSQTDLDPVGKPGRSPAFSTEWRHHGCSIVRFR